MIWLVSSIRAGHYLQLTFKGFRLREINTETLLICLCSDIINGHLTASYAACADVRSSFSCMLTHTRTRISCSFKLLIVVVAFLTVCQDSWQWDLISNEESSVPAVEIYNFNLPICKIYKPDVKHFYDSLIMLAILQLCLRCWVETLSVTIKGLYFFEL